MKLKPVIEKLIYLAIILLALIAIALVFSSPAGFMQNRVVYGGF